MGDRVLDVATGSGEIFDIAGFRDIRVRPETREGSYESFDEY